MANNGELTARRVTQALQKAADSVDADFGKTTETVAQNFTKLQNAFTKFVGENGSGSANALAQSIGLLAENLDLAAAAATSLAAGYLTKTIIAGTVAVRERVAETIRATAADRAQQQVEIQRARQALAQAALDRQLAASALQRAEAQVAASVAALQAERQLGVVTLATTEAVTAAKAAEVTARAASTNATIAETVATNRLAVAQTVTATGGRAILGLLGGPTGLAIAAASVAAGFLMMSDSTDKAAQAMGDLQGPLDMTLEKFQALTKVQQDAAIAKWSIDQRDKAKELEKTYDSLTSKIYVAVQAQTGFNAEGQQMAAGYIKKIEGLTKSGQSALPVLGEMQKSLNIPQSSIDQIVLLVGAYDKQAKAIKDADAQIKSLQTSQSAATGSSNAATEALNRQADAAQRLTKAQQEAAKARAWLEGNPTKKKTRRGMKKFLNGWLARSQGDAEKSKASTGPVETTGRELTAEDMRPAKWLREANV